MSVWPSLTWQCREVLSHHLFEDWDGHWLSREVQLCQYGLADWQYREVLHHRPSVD